MTAEREHMNGRVYDYRLGRFLSVDPIISNPADSQSINPYSYIGNNPLSGVDPTGYESCPQPPTGTHVCGNNANAVNFVTTTWFNPPETKSSGATPQGTQQANANPRDESNPTNTAKLQPGSDRQPKVLSWDFAAGLAFGASQQGTPGGFLLGSPAVDNPSFELGRSISLSVGALFQGFEAGKLVAGGLTLEGVGPLTGPGEAVAAPAGVAVAGVGIAVGAQALGNGIEAVRAFSNANPVVQAVGRHVQTSR